jgi:hypothetical protein
MRPWLQYPVELEVLAEYVSVPREHPTADPAEVSVGWTIKRVRKGTNPLRADYAVVIGEQKQVATARVDAPVSRRTWADAPFISNDPNAERCFAC